MREAGERRPERGNPEGGNVTIKWEKTKTGATGEGSTRCCTYRFVIEPGSGLAAYSLDGVIFNTATGAVISEGHLGSASTVAACKRMAAWNMETGGPNLDARIEGGAE